MIPARKFSLGKRLVWRLIDRSLRKYFDRVYFRTRTNVSAEREETLPMLLCANHSSWWDGYVIALIDHMLGTDGYLMVEEKQLRRYFFFSWLGCFSVDRQNTRSALQSLKYAASLLQSQGPARRMVSLFPQGEIFPNDSRPLVFYNGLAYLAKMVNPLQCYPVAIRIEYLKEQRPALFISIGEPILITTEETRQHHFLKNCTSLLETLLTRELDQLRDDVVAGNYASFQTALRGKSSANRIFDTLLFRKQIARQ